MDTNTTNICIGNWLFRWRSYLLFMEEYGVIELRVPKGLIGKTLQEANMINRFGVQVVAIKEIIPGLLGQIKDNWLCRINILASRKKRINISCDMNFI